MKKKANRALHPLPSESANALRATLHRRLVAALVLGTVAAIPVKSLAADATNAVPVKAGKVETKSDADLMSLDLDALANTKVTSASKKEEKLSDTTTAITVLTGDDIRRSGATTIPDALRLVPGMDVAQINSGTWAVSARGFNEQYSRNLLVLVDGRTVFLPFNGGVLWDLQEQMLGDLDRIEVIRGPGGTLWGANAVNGVINIVSKSARDTQGTYLYGGAGNFMQTMDGGRYGGKIDDNTFYRVYGSYQNVTSMAAPNNSSTDSGFQGGQGGFRLDHYNGEASHGTVQADATYNDLNDHMSRDYNVNTVGRWTRNFSDHSSFELQGYFDRTVNNGWGGVDMGIDTYDLTAQQNLSLGERNDAVFGVGYRYWDVHLGVLQDPTLIHVPNFDEHRADGFAQDTFKIIPDKWTVTAGAKVEYNSITGVELEPNVRTMFKPAENQTLWAAVSRSVLVPTLKAGFDGYRQPDNIGPMNTYDVGNPNIKSAPVWTYEAGYRIQPTKRISVDLAAYYSRYYGLQNQVQTGMIYTWENAFDAETYGGEASVTWQAADSLRLTAFYSMMHINEWGPVPDTDVWFDSPQDQAGVRASWDITKHISADAQVRYVEQVTGADSYVAANLRLAYHPTDKVEFSVFGQNVGEPKHAELGAGNYGEVPEGVYGQVSVKF